MENHHGISQPNPEQERTEKNGYPQPQSVVEAAMAKIEPDGSVMFFDEEASEWYKSEPIEPIDISEMPDDVYRSHLIQVARMIAGDVMNIGSKPAFTGAVLECIFNKWQ